MKHFTFLKKQALLYMLLLAGFFSFAQTYETGITVSTLAGSTLGTADGTGTAAQFNNPAGVAVDVSGNVYVADRNSHLIRKTSPVGVVTTFAGSSQGYVDGTGTAAQFNYPQSVAVDASGNVYVADIFNHKIRKISPAGVVSTLAGSTGGYADGTGTAAKFYYPQGVAVDVSGNVYVADYYNHKIRKISPAGVVSTLAGSSIGYTDGTGTVAQFKYPTGVAVDNASGNVYVADTSNQKIRKITPAGVVSTLAGSTSGYADGTGTAALFNSPYSVAVDMSGNVYVADTYNQKIRKITPAGVVTTLAGSTAGYVDGTGTAAQFGYPIGVAVDNASGNLYVGDYDNNKIRKITGAVLSTASYTQVGNFTVYPNPSNGIFNIEALTNATITVFDMVGKQVSTQKETIGTATVNLSSFTAGVYFAKITTENNQTQTVKLIKE